MRRNRRHIVFLMAVMLPLSALTGTGPYCEHCAESANSSTASAKNPHAHHTEGFSSSSSHLSSQTEHAEHLIATSEGINTEAHSEGYCADACADACVFSGSNPVTLSESPSVQPINQDIRVAPLRLAFVDGPAPSVLFRPPIITR